MNLGMISASGIEWTGEQRGAEEWTLCDCGSGGLTVWILIRTVNVIGTHDDRLDGIAMPERSNEHLCSRFAATIGVHGLQDVVLAVALRSRASGAVCLIGGHLDEFLDSACFCALEEDLGTDDVRESERGRVLEACVDVGLSREVDDGVDVVSAEAGGDVFCGGDVSLVEREVLPAIQHLGIVQSGSII